MNAYAIGVRLLGSILLIGLAGGVFAQQDYPNRPIRYILPYAPGGSTTGTARLVGQRLTEAWGQQVVIDYRAGANTIIGTEAAVRSKPDGYTLIYIGSALAANHRSSRRLMTRKKTLHRSRASPVSRTCWPCIRRYPSRR